MKKKSRTIADLEEVSRLAAEKRVVDEELAQLQPLRQYESDLGRLRKELEERDIELSRVQEESGKKLTLDLPWGG